MVVFGILGCGISGFGTLGFGNGVARVRGARGGSPGKLL